MVTLVLALLPVGAADVSELSGRAMGTTWSAKWVSPAAPLNVAAVREKITARLEQLEDVFSTYRPESELSRFNEARGTDWFPVSADLAEVALEARAISALTSGAFDVTVDPLVRLWGFGPGGRVVAVPHAMAIADARARVDWRQLEGRLEPPAVRRMREGATADLSSLAKGFSADALSELLRSLGAPNHFVQIGGDVKTAGRAADGKAWQTGIETPEEVSRTIARVVSLSGEALSTAGDYRNHFWHEGRRVGHIIDPRTGSPVGGVLASVTVIHPHSCARSSALATALFVLGAEEGYRLAVQQKLACILFVRSGSGFEQRLTPELAARLR